MKKEYPSMKVCNSDKLQMVLDLAEEKLEKKNPMDP